MVDKDLTRKKSINHIAPDGHPIHTLMEEHRHVLDFAEKLTLTATDLKHATEPDTVREKLKFLDHLIEHFKSAQSHYLREENVLFAYLDKHGIVGPPKAMWAEHDQIRILEKEIFQIYDDRDNLEISDMAGKLLVRAEQLQQLLSSHFYKENNVLFPMAMKTLTDLEWQNTKREFDEIGYCCFTPETAKKQPKSAETESVVKVEEGMVDLGTGKLSTSELRAMLNNLPVEITFVDKDDTFRYFNQVKDAVFTRTKAAVGLKVQKCHPEKSVYLVNKIINDFRSGAKDEVSFWIDFKNKYIYIRYFAVRDEGGNYLGCMEVTQDIKDIQKISGEKRLMES